MASPNRTPVRMFASALYSTSWFIVFAALAAGVGKGCIMSNRGSGDQAGSFLAGLGGDAFVGLCAAAGFFALGLFFAALARKWARPDEPADEI